MSAHLWQNLRRHQSTDSLETISLHFLNFVRQGAIKYTSQHISEAFHNPRIHWSRDWAVIWLNVSCDGSLFMVFLPKNMKFTSTSVPQLRFHARHLRFIQMQRFLHAHARIRKEEITLLVDILGLGDLPSRGVQNVASQPGIHHLEQTTIAQVG